MEVLFLPLLVLLLRIGNHVVKAQICEVYVQIVQVAALERHHHLAVYLINQAEVDQVGAGFNDILVVAGTAKGKVNVVQVGKICFLLKFFPTILVNEFYRFIQPGLGVVYDLKFLWRWVKLRHKVLGDGLALAVTV